MAPNLRYHKWCLRQCANYVSSGHTSGAPSQHGQYRHLAEKTGDVEGTNPNKIPQPTQSQSRNLTRVAQVERCQYHTATNTDFGAKQILCTCNLQHWEAQYMWVHQGQRMALSGWWHYNCDSVTSTSCNASTLTGTIKSTCKSTSTCSNTRTSTSNERSASTSTKTSNQQLEALTSLERVAAGSKLDLSTPSLSPGTLGGYKIHSK